MAHGNKDWTQEVWVPLSFLNLQDTPGLYTGQAGKGLKVDAGEVSLIFTDMAPDAHHTRHEEGGTDEVTEITGKLNAHHTRHEVGGADPINIDAHIEAIILNRQKAAVHVGSAQSIPDNVFTTLNLDTVDFDPSGIVDIVNHRIKPTRAGYYIVSFQTQVSTGSVSTWSQNTIANAAGGIYRGSSASTNVLDASSFGSGVVYFNGSSDYVFLQVVQISGGAKNLSIAKPFNYLCLVGPF